MKKFLLLFAFIVFCINHSNSFAKTTFKNALEKAYLNNPSLNAQRESLKITNEQMPTALSGYMPSVSADYSIGNRDSVQGGNTSDEQTQVARISLNQPLFRGGQTLNGVKRAENIIIAQRNQLAQTEQDVLLEAVGVYLDLVRDLKLLDLSNNNVRVLRKQYDVTLERFNLGEVTKTDVAQSEASFALAKSEKISAYGNYERSKARYTRVINSEPFELEVVNDPFEINYSLEQMLEIALNENPTIQNVRFNIKAAENLVRVEKGRLLPSMSLSASKDEQKGALFANGDIENEVVTVDVNVPLFQSGSEYSSVRSAKLEKLRLEQTLKDQILSINEAVIRSYNNLKTAQAIIISNLVTIEASEIALDGTREEAKVGSRTTLDVLEAERDLFQAKVNLISSKRDEIVSSYELLAFIGRLNADFLKLNVDKFNPEEHYRKVKYKFIGF